MEYREMLDSLIEQHEGLILTKDVTEAGIPRTYLSSLVKEGILEQVEYDFYLYNYRSILTLGVGD